MAELELEVPDEVEEKFKMKALAVFGEEDDPVDRAVEQAIDEWVEKVLDEE